MKKRASGVLMHFSSLPSKYGIGDLGPAAYEFADFLAETKQQYWQILPTTPTNSFCGNSPYSSISAFAGNLLFISPDLLLNEGLLNEKDLKETPVFSKNQCEFEKVIPYKMQLLEKAYNKFQADGHSKNDFEWFCGEHSCWLDDYSLFVVLKREFDDKGWNDWPENFSKRQPAALNKIKTEKKEELQKERFFQFLFYKQWFALKSYCNERAVQFIGDIPIYVNYDSADVWVYPELFKLDSNFKPKAVAGVPPDYFSKTGQLWGNPVYNWEIHEKTGFNWWHKRIAHNLHLVNQIRIDHFRGLVAYWEVSAEEKTAINGQWVKVPVDKLLESIRDRYPHFPIIAEDLGVITDDVRECLHRYNIPGMKILLFAFCSDDAEHPYLPHNYERNCVVYTGTHDNNTVLGWYENNATKEEKEQLAQYIGRKVKKEDLPWTMIRMAMQSVADIALVPIQDILCLGGEARMNKPAVAYGNWSWRMEPAVLTKTVRTQLKIMTQIYGRAKK